ncbi:MAG: type VI secretion system-associated FHA domain protein TagH [Burkholderiaceae bacterium]|nr:type VI secretion system-associated FHA domain protein TagH [Burkholderiaceae bacterium]
MLILKVVSQFGQPLAAQLSARFGAEGGTIGRSPDCTMVLPDPGKHISRQQARVHFADGVYSLTCIGSANALLVNRAEVGTGQAVQLRPGDSVMIAQYEMRVVIEQEAGASPAAPAATDATIRAARPGDAGGILEDFDPFSEEPFATPAENSAASAAARPRGTTDFERSDHGETARAPIDDPLGGFGVSRPAARSAEPVDDELGLGGASGRVPDAGRRESESIDALFGLSDSTPDPLGLDSPLAAPNAQPNTSLASDPMASLSASSGSDSIERSNPDDRGSELSGSFRLPEAIPPTSFGIEAPGRGRTRDAPREAPREMPREMPPEAPRADPHVGRHVEPPAPERPVSERPVQPREPAGDPPRVQPETGGGQGQIPATVRLDPDEIRSITDRVADEHRGDFEVPATTTRSTDIVDSLNRAQIEAIRAHLGSVGSPAATPAQGADPGFELLKGLLLGLGLSELPKSLVGAQPGATALSPELMKRIGELLRIATQGAIDLLQARATIKRELKAEVTMIVSRDNNPLKFSPDALTAMSHLLGPQTVRGFMPPEPAMRDVFHDLLAHQVAFIAGMRAAMEGLIARFDPAQLEARITRKTVIDSMLPMARRARLWELFNDLYAEISREAEDDFESLFGREFLRAYEDQIARLKGDGR